MKLVQLNGAALGQAIFYFYWDCGKTLFVCKSTEAYNIYYMYEKE